MDASLSPLPMGAARQSARESSRIHRPADGRWSSRTPATIDFFSFFSCPRSATIRHFDYTDSDVSDGEDLATVVRLTTTGRLHPEIGARSLWSETSERIADLRQRRILGKAILTIE